MFYILCLIIPLLPIYYVYIHNKQRISIRNLKDKVVLITGASSGLGEACSLKFYEAGCKLILCSRGVENLENVKNSLLQLKINNPHIPEIVQIDISKHDSLKMIADIILQKFKRVDILLNNAGLSYRGTILETKIEVHKEIMDVNYFGQIELTKAFLPHWIENRYGHVVFIGSLQSKLALPFRSAYGASKHALQSYADCLRSELSAYNVKVTVILPAYINTKLSINALTSDGSIYNAMDETQKQGISTSIAANQILISVATLSKEVLITSPIYKFVVYLRNVLPDFYFYVMSRRAVKRPT